MMNIQDELNSVELIFLFWSRLGQTENLSDGQALTNTHIPFYLSNALWAADLEQEHNVIKHYEQNGLPPALIVSSQISIALKEKLERSSFSFEKFFSLREASAAKASSKDLLVEQVNWQQMRYAAELLANHYEQSELAFELTKQLAELMQNHSDVMCFMAYDLYEAVGMMIVHETRDAFIAHFLVDKNGHLEQRLYAESVSLNKPAFVLEETEKSTQMLDSRGLERWSQVK